MKENIIYQRLYGLILVSSFIFLSDALSLRGQKMDFYGRGDTFVSLANTIPELSQLTACIDLKIMANSSSHWTAFSYITNNTLQGTEDIDLGLAGDHQQLILYNLDRTFYISYRLTPFQWHTLCLLWDGVKGRLELLLNNERMLRIVDQPHSLTPGGTLVLGGLPKSGESQAKSTIAHLTGSLYYFQLWDRLLENGDFTKCLHGNIVSWEEDVWLLHKITPTVDRRLRCFVSENMTIQETSTTVSQQIDLTTSSQMIGLNPQEAIYSTTVISKSMPLLATNYTIISYSNTTTSPLATMTTPSNLKSATAETAIFATGVLSTPTIIPLPTQHPLTLTTTDSMKVTDHPHSEKTRTTKMVEVMATETFHPTTATNFFSTSGITKDSIISESLTTKSQSTVMKTTSLFSTNKSTSISTTSWLKNKSTDVAVLSTSKNGQEFLVSSVPRSVSGSTVEETSAANTGIVTVSAFPLESLLTSIAAPVDYVFPENQMSSTLATPEVAFTVQSVMPMETTPALKTVGTESTSTDFQFVSSPNMEDPKSTFVPKEISSRDPSSMTSSSVTGTQSRQMVADIVSTHASRSTLARLLAETSVSPTIERPVYTPNTLRAGEPILTLISTESFSPSTASESGPTSVIDETVHHFTNETTWTSRPGQTLLTSVNTTTILSFIPNENFTPASHGNVTNTDNLIVTTGVASLEASIGSKATSSSDSTTARYTTALLKLTSQLFGNFSSVSGITPISNLPEFKLTTLLPKTIPMSTLATNEYSSRSRETIAPSVDTSTLPDIKRGFSTEERTFETTQTEINGMNTFGNTTALLPKSATTNQVYATVTRKETTIAAVAEVSSFSAMLEVTDESAQMVTASVTVSPFPDMEKFPSALDNETATTGVGLSWLPTKVMKTPPKTSYNGTTEAFDLNQTYTARWISESSEGNFGPLLTSVSTQTSSELMSTSSTRITGTSFSIAPTHTSAMSLSAGVLPSQTAATPQRITHVFSLPVNVSAVASPVTSMLVSDETKVTMSEPSTLATSMRSDASILPTATITTALGQPPSTTASTTSNTMSTHRNSLHTTSEVPVIPTTAAFMEAPSMTETLIPSLRSPTPVITKAKSTHTSTPADLVTPSSHALVCSKPPIDNTSIISTSHVSLTTSTPVATPLIAQKEVPSTHAVSYPYSFSTGDVSLTTGPTETFAVDKAMHKHTSTSKLTTAVGTHISESSTHLVNIPGSTQLVTGTSAPSDKEQVSLSLGKTHKTMEVTKIFPSKNSFIFYSPSTTPLKMTDTVFSETTHIPSHQTHLPLEGPFGTQSDWNSAASPNYESTQTVDTLTSSNTAGVHISEISTSLDKTSIPSQVQTRTKTVSPVKESISILSGYTPSTVERIVSSSSLTHSTSYYEDILFGDATTSRTTEISNPLLINITLSHLPSLTTHSEVTAAASSTPGSSPFRTGLPNANFTAIVPSVSNAPATLPGETYMATSIPIYQESSLPVNVTAFTFEKVSDTPTLLMTKSSKITYPGCLKSPSVATSDPMSEKSSLPINGYASSPTAVSNGISTGVGSFSTSMPSTTPRTTKIIQSSTLDIISGTYARTPAKSTMLSSAFPDPEMIEVYSRIITTPISSSTEPDFPPMETIPTTLTPGLVTSVVGTTTSSLISSKITDVISSTLKTMASPLPSTTQQSPKEEEAATLGILTGVMNNSLSNENSGRVTVLTNTYSRTTSPKSVFTPTPSHSLHTPSNIQISPSLTSFKNTSGPTESVKSTTTYLFSKTEKMTSLSENTFLTSEPIKTGTSVNIPVLYPAWTQSRVTPPSLTSPLNSPHSTRAEFSTPKISPPTSQMFEFPVLRTRSTSNIIPQSLLTTSWLTPPNEDSQFPISTTTHALTSNKMEADTLNFIPGSLLTLTASQTSSLSRAATAVPSISTSEILPAFGLSENTSLSISSRALPTTLGDIKHTFEKTTTSLTPKTTLPSNPSIMSRPTSSVMTLILSSLPPGSPLATVSKASHVLTSSAGEELESTLSASDTVSTYPFTNLTTLSFGSGSTIHNQITPVTTTGSLPTGSPTSLLIATNSTGDSVYISTSLKSSSRITGADRSNTVSFGRMNTSTPTSDCIPSIGSLSLPSPTKTSSWNRVPAISTSSTLVPPRPSLNSLINITSTPTATGALFSLMSTGATHPSTEAMSLLMETAWMDSTSSILSTEAWTSLMGTESTVSFYNIDTSFSVFDEEPRILITSVVNEFAKIWLNSLFQYSEFSLANLAIQIKRRDTSREEMAMYQYIWEQRKRQGMATISHVPYSCTCQAIIKANSSLAPMELISRIRNKIYGNSTHGNFIQDQLTLLVKSEQVAVKKLEPGKCNADETPSKYKGIYKWLLTDPTETAQTQCIKNENEYATRICSINIQTGKSQWEKPRFKQCRLLQGLPEKIVDLANITISDENADDVAEHILKLVNESPPLDEEETKIIVSKVADISKCDEISMNLTRIILQVIGAVSEKQIDSASSLPPVRNEILRIIERVGHKMEFVGRTANLTVARLALAVLRVDHRFEGLAFSICSREEVTAPEIFLGDIPLGRVLASIYLPKSLRERISLNSLQTILFNFFGQTSLFKAININTVLTTYVVSASISNMSIQNLADPVVITLQHLEGNWDHDQIYCAFWDFNENNGLGGWNSSGCKVKETNVNYTICQCNHLTHFGVLMDLSRSTVDAVNERILVIITYTGCGISSIFLGIAMVTYIAFHKLRRDYPSKILINLCAALLMLNLAFLLNSWLSSFQKVGLCVTAAVAVHYFLLVSLTWMGLEAVHMYFALVKVFNTYIPNYILKFGLAGWGIPAIAVAIILSVRKDLYGTLSPTTPFCWIRDDSVFYISVVAYFCLIFLVNLSMFCTVLAQLNSVKSQTQKTRRKMILHDLKGTISLTFLLGLTWGFAFFAWGPVRIFFMYLFAICNTLQGFLIFVFYCVMKESVREQWHTHLCCRWLRLDTASDGTSRFGINVRYKRERLRKTLQHKLFPPSLKSTASSSTFKSIGSAPGTPSEINFPNDDFDEDSCFSSLSCEVMPNCIRRILPEEIKSNSIHKQRCSSINLSKDTHLPSALDWRKC